ncbi:hypothetical protein OIU78_001571 [Salix suchowensis]|nr:hypothetical protein OIU78_001571 [Salix suchowensis]
MSLAFQFRSIEILLMKDSIVLTISPSALIRSSQSHHPWPPYFKLSRLAWERKRCAER